MLAAGGGQRILACVCSRIEAGGGKILLNCGGGRPCKKRARMSADEKNEESELGLFDGRGSMRK